MSTAIATRSMHVRLQSAQALGEAMDRRRAFSWTRNEPSCGNRRTDVQCGVYIRHSQGHFQQYILPILVVRAQCGLEVEA